MSETEGSVYIEALRNIIADGVYSGLFVKQKSITDKQLPGSNSDEKYTNFLKSKGISDTSVLREINTGKISFTGRDSKYLFVYFYAVPIQKDDDNDESTILNTLLQGISKDDMVKLLGALSRDEPKQISNTNNQSNQMLLEMKDDREPAGQEESMNVDNDQNYQNIEPKHLTDKNKTDSLDEYFDDEDEQKRQHVNATKSNSSATKSKVNHKASVNKKVKEAEYSDGDAEGEEEGEAKLIASDDDD
jgi:hypothetical protein